RGAVDPHEEGLDMALAAERRDDADPDHAVRQQLLPSPGHRGYRRTRELGDRRPARAAVLLEGHDDAAVEVADLARERRRAHRVGGTTRCRNSRTVLVHASASSIWGECPDFSNTTISEFGTKSAITWLHDTGVIQSVRPTVIKVGTVISCRRGLRSYAGRFTENA